MTPPVVEPDLLTKIRYRWGWSIPEDYRPWVERDVYSRAFWWWQLMSLILAAGFAWFLIEELMGHPSWAYLIGWAVTSVLTMSLFIDYRRRRFLEWHEKRWTRARQSEEGPDFRRFP